MKQQLKPNRSQIRIQCHSLDKNLIDYLISLSCKCIEDFKTDLLLFPRSALDPSSLIAPCASSYSLATYSYAISYNPQIGYLSMLPFALDILLSDLAWCFHML